MATAATYLFVPGNRPERFQKALDSGADVVVLDLEDAVAPEAKADARLAIAAWCARETPSVLRMALRINDHSTPWFADDLNVLRQSAIATVLLPKAEAPADVERVTAALPMGCRVIPIIESARGAMHVDAIAATPGVQRLAFGTLDYALDLDLSGDERGLVTTANRIAIASKCAGILSPIAGVSAALDDDAQLQADLEFARACGFGAKLCIHPKQVAMVNQFLTPTEAEIDWARRVVTAAKGSAGAFQLDGRMVDRPVLRKAEAILARAGSAGGQQA